MKITQIQIDGFGKWQSTNFNLSPNLQVIYGANEAGKSTLTQFILSVLFGFANHSGKNKYLQYIPKDTASYGGVILFEHEGQEYRLKRTKGKKVSGQVEFSTETGESLTEEQLAQIISPLNEELYRAILSFSQNDLNSIFDLTTDEIDATLQQMGTVGSAQWMKLVKNYEKSANAIYKDSGRVLPINVKLQEHQELQDRIDEAKLDYNRYHDLVEANNLDSIQKKELTKDLSNLQTKDNELEQLNRLMPIYKKLQGMGQVDTTDFNSDDEIKINQIVTKENELQRSIKQSESDLKVIDGQQYTSEKQKFYFEHLAEFEHVNREVPKIKQAIVSQQEMINELQLVNQELAKIKAKYQEFGLPKSLANEQKQVLDDLLSRKAKLLDQQDSILTTRSTQKNQAADTKSKAILFIGVAVVGIVLAILFTTLIMRILGVVLLIGGAIGWYLDSRKTNLSNDTSINDGDGLLAQVNNEITQFGKTNGLQDYSVNQWSTIQFESSQFDEQSRQVQILNQKLADIELIIDTFMAQNTELGTWIDGDHLANSLDKIEEYHDEQQHAVSLAQKNNEKRKLLTAQIDEQQQRLIKIAEDKQELLEQVGVNSIEEFNVKYRDQLTKIDMNADKKALAGQINGEQLTKLATYDDVKQLKKQLEQLRKKTSEIKVQRDELETNVNRRNLTIESIAKNGLLSELRQQLADLETEINELVVEWLHNQFASLWINQTLQAASSDRLPQIITQAKRYFKLLTDDRYIDIVLADGIKVMDEEHVEFEVGELSQGTAEQLYVALRFGFITVMNEKINFPLIIDDGFVNFDNSRKNRTIELLKELSDRSQVIYLTADDRILRMYNSEQVINLDEK
ncbi:hypothetical protein FC70_GL000582 [Paucilactobacillus oligofermentans DSM 15707 = LMG 22743]|uniref:YhaN AAA domain-containing protein n=1 Tax=Paucilactobacillus oligofermentans DSM 15707 = LMG 22743 TaxID=1423778 RepID=A0A0R1RGA3_9LACO|nr:AAA family ATPase [Paucilactobacillus oligofermentans]KRL55997.1 hypothetical protein FC70_GL000582 [Paucilactobacillus oligofermentans DSM 15707 = LMG 22743]CUS26021.1 Putative DNA repair ATPase YhaN [Paucilactobacillus oligofermentans DSM 15707 = LMG 22743]